MIQYTLIRGVNDQLEEAAKLADLLQDIKTKVNLIPLNTISSSRFEAPTYENVRGFSAFLRKAGIQTTIRYSKGQDIAAGCGQLIVKKTN